VAEIAPVQARRTVEVIELGLDAEPRAVLVGRHLPSFCRILPELVTDPVQLAHDAIE
jgi:hypothetical protein